MLHHRKEKNTLARVCFPRDVHKAMLYHHEGKINIDVCVFSVGVLRGRWQGLGEKKGG
jgi:hypothetical protein